MLTIVQHVVVRIVKMLVELHLTGKSSIDNTTQYCIEDDGCHHVVVWKGQERQGAEY